MSDWFDESDDAPAPREDRPEPASGDEGVRILGAEEVGTAPDLPTPRRSRRGAETSASPEALDIPWGRPDDPPPAAPPPAGMPHWSEPPTGEVPRSLIGDAEPEAEGEAAAWSALAAPRFRSGAGDWAEGDFGDEGLAHDDQTAIGALATPPDDDDAWGEVGATAVGSSAEDDDLPPPDRRVRRRTAPLPRAPRTRYETNGPPQDLTTRVATGVVLGVIAAICFVIGRGASLVLATALVGIAAFELYEGFRRAGYHVATVLGLMACVAIVPIAYDQGAAAFPLVLFLAAVFTALWYLADVVRARPTINIALTLLGVVYVGGLGAFAGLLLGLSEDGVGYLLGVVICVAAFDVASFVVGSAVGHTKLHERISPNKTLEGLIAGVVAALLFGAILGETLHPWDGGIGDGLLLGLAVAVLAPIGDLFESMIKRDLGVKDLGTLLPGHGGVMDRFDSLLFALPAAYYVALHLL